MSEHSGLWKWGFLILVGTVTIYIVSPVQVGQTTVSATVTSAHIYQIQNCGLFVCGTTPEEDVVFTLSNGVTFDRSYSCSYFTKGMNLTVDVYYEIPRVPFGPSQPLSVSQNITGLYTQPPNYSVNGVPQAC